MGICYPPFSKIITVNAVAQADIQPADQPDIGGNSTLGNNQLLSPLEGISANRVENISSGAGLSSPVSTAVTDSSPSSGSTSTLGSMLQGSNDDEEILDPEVAFTIDPTAIENGSIALKWNVHEGYFLYRDRFSFKLISPDNATIGEADVSRGKIKQDEFFGEVEVIRNTATANIPITLPENVSNATLKVGYQGCADVGICFPPIYKEINLVEIAAVARSQSDAGVIGAVSSGNTGSGNTGVGAASATTSTATNTTLAAVTDTGSSSNIAASTSANAPLAQQDVLANSLKNNNRWITIATFFGLGLLLTFTPCVLPMIPILSSIIVGSGDKISTGRAFSLSLVYVLAMAATYTVAGVLVGLSGENIQGILQHPFVLSAIALLFVILAASMFGMFEFQMPAFVQNRLSAVSNKQKSGSFGGVATMGFLSALIVGPCITAPLVGALIYIGQTGDAVLGGAALFALSMGMGLPLLIIGTTFGKFLPRAGAWMDTTKAVFGVLLLGLAIYMLDRVIPTWATMLLSALLLISVGMFMGAFESLPTGAKGWHRVSKGFGYASIVYGTLLLVGVATGTGSLFQPIQGLTVANSEVSAQQQHATFQRVKSVEQLKVALSDAQANNKPVMLDFYADWCISCKEMEKFTFTDQKVAAQMNQAILLQADVTKNDALDKELMKEFGIYGPPAIILYDKNGVEQASSRVVGFMSADKFSNVLASVF